MGLGWGISCCWEMAVSLPSCSYMLVKADSERLEHRIGGCEAGGILRSRVAESVLLLISCEADVLLCGCIAITLSLQIDSLGQALPVAFGCHGSREKEEKWKHLASRYRNLDCSVFLLGLGDGAGDSHR